MTTHPKRRIHTRYPGTLTVQIERDGVRRFGLINQISLGGAFIEMAPAPPAGTKLTIIIMRPTGVPLRLPAESRYIRNERIGDAEFNGMGVAWGELDPEARAFVQELVARAQTSQPLRGSRDPSDPGLSQ